MNVNGRKLVIMQLLINDMMNLYVIVYVNFLSIQIIQNNDDKLYLYINKFKNVLTGDVTNFEFDKDSILETIQNENTLFQ